MLLNSSFSQEITNIVAVKIDHFIKTPNELKYIQLDTKGKLNSSYPFELLEDKIIETKYLLILEGKIIERKF